MGKPVVHKAYWKYTSYTDQGGNLQEEYKYRTRCGERASTEDPQFRHRWKGVTCWECNKVRPRQPKRSIYQRPFQERKDD